jgi:hypothetical protein
MPPGAAESVAPGLGDVTENPDCCADVGNGAAGADAEIDRSPVEAVAVPAAGFDAVLVGDVGADVHETAKVAVSMAIAIRRICFRASPSKKIARRPGLAGEPGVQLAWSA